MLIDLDLAISDGERTVGRHQAGTLQFMAMAVLRNKGVEHTCRQSRVVLLCAVMDVRSSVIA